MGIVPSAAPRRIVLTLTLDNGKSESMILEPSGQSFLATAHGRAMPPGHGMPSKMDLTNWVAASGPAGATPTQLESRLLDREWKIVLGVVNQAAKGDVSYDVSYGFGNQSKSGGGGSSVLTVSRFPGADPEQDVQFTHFELSSSIQDTSTRLLGWVLCLAALALWCWGVWREVQRDARWQLAASRLYRREVQSILERPPF
jgi:hypothetical protein